MILPPQVLCPYNKDHGFIEQENYHSHINLFHEAQIQETAIQSLETAKEKAEVLLRKFPSARSNNGVLIQKFFQYYGFKGIRLIWDSTNQVNDWNRKPSFEETIGLLEMVETITRAGRAIRRKYPELQGSRKVTMARELKGEAYRQFFGNEGIE